jgi:hypothetical protein
MHLKDIGREVVDWIHMVQDREEWRALVNKVMNLLISCECWELLVKLSIYQLLKSWLNVNGKN